MTRLTEREICQYVERLAERDDLSFPHALSKYVAYGTLTTIHLLPRPFSDYALMAGQHWLVEPVDRQRLHDAQMHCRRYLKDEPAVSMSGQDDVSHALRILNYALSPDPQDVDTDMVIVGYAADAGELSGAIRFFGTAEA